MNLFASTHTWTGAVNGNWSNAGNWTGGTPASNESNLIIIFDPAAANLSNTNDISGLVVQSVSYTAASSSTSCSSSGDAITVTAGVTVGAHVTAMLAMNVTFSLDQTINVQGNLNMAGAVGGSGNLSFTGVQNFSGINPSTGVLAVTGGSTNTVAVLRSSSFGGLLVGGTYGDIVCLSTNALGSGSGITEFNLNFRPNYQLSCGTLDLNVNSPLDFLLNGLAAGTTYSQITVNNRLKLSGNTLTTSLGFSPKIGDQFTIIRNNSTNPVVGNFYKLLEGATLAPENTVYGEILQISYVGGSGHDVVLTVVSTNTTSSTPLVILIPTYTNAVTSQIVPIAAAVSKSRGGGYPANFYDGVTFIGSGTSQSDRSVKLETFFTSVGTHTITAVYTNSSGSYTSAPVNIVITAGPNFTAFESPMWLPTGFQNNSTLFLSSQAMTLGPDGNMWATGFKSLRPSAIGVLGGYIPTGFLSRITPQGAIADWALPFINGTGVVPTTIGIGTGPTNELWFGGPYFLRSDLNGNTQVTLNINYREITIGLDGNVWFTYNGLVVGWYTPTNGASLTFPTPTANSGAAVMATTRDGTVWFEESNISGVTQLGKISSTNGPVTEVRVPNGNFAATKMRGHPDGTLWLYGMLYNQPQILCRWETNGVLRVFQTRGQFALYGEDFIPSPDGGVWYTVSVSGFGGGVGTGRIGHLDANGVSTEYLVPNTLTLPASLALAADGSLWYGQAGQMGFGVMASPGVGPAKQPTVTTLTVSPNPAGIAPNTCVATVTAPGGGVPTGFVVFSYTGEAVPLTNGVATLTTLAGAQQAAYCGDANYFGSLSQPFPILGGLPSRVAQSQFGPSIIHSLGAIPAPSTTGSFDVTTDLSSANFLTGGTPTGTVTIVMDGTTILGTGNLSPYLPFVGATPDGTNRFTVSGYGPGQHFIQAIYNGDANFDSIASLPFRFLGVAPSPLAATTVLALSTSSAQAGQMVTLTATVTGAGTPESLVDFLDGTNLVGRAILHGGVAVLNYVFPPGAHSLTAHFEGDYSFNPADSSTSSLSITGGTSQPQLLFVQAPGALVLSWPTSVSGFTLEATPNLATPNWTAVGTTPVTINNQFTVTNATTQPAGFFRLRK